MQSSPIVAIRSLVMLVSMIVVPLIAVLWNRVPAILRAVTGESPAIHDGTGAQVHSSARRDAMSHGYDHASRSAKAVDGGFQGLSGAANLAQSFAAAASAEAGAEFGAGDQAAAIQAAMSQGGRGFAGPQASVATSPVDTALAMQSPAAAGRGFNVSAWSRRDPQARAVATLPPASYASDAFGSTSPQQHPPAYSRSVTDVTSGHGAAGDGPHSAAGNSELRGQLSRLEQLGATYYLLETWGRTAGLYRFHCNMSLSGSPNHTRRFEATDQDPLRAIERVVQEVEQWRSTRVR